MKKPQIRTPWAALVAALGASAAMLPAHAQYGGNPGAIDAQGQTSRGMQGQGSPGGMQGTGPGMQSPQGMGQGMHGTGGQDKPAGLTREQVQAEAQAWRRAGLTDLMVRDDSSAWLQPEVLQRRDEVAASVESERGMAGSGTGAETRDAGGMAGSGAMQSPAPAQQPMGEVQLQREPTGPEVTLSEEEARRAMQGGQPGGTGMSPQQERDASGGLVDPLQQPAQPPAGTGLQAPSDPRGSSSGMPGADTGGSPGLSSPPMDSAPGSASPPTDRPQ